MRTLVLALIVACAPSESEQKRIDHGLPPSTSHTATTTTTDTGTTTTSGPTTTYDCTTPWPDSLGPAIVGSVPASEDFDIDADGNLIHVEQRNLVARSSIDNSVTIISPDLTWSAAGTRVLATGDIVVADTFNGVLLLVDRQTGGSTPLLAGNWPNGIDVDADHNVYVSDFSYGGNVTRINAYNPSDSEVLLDNVDQPNGVALSPDGNSLYVAFNWDNDIWVLHKDANGTWGAPELFHDTPGAAQSVTTDICGTVYWEAFDTVKRQTADGTQEGQVTTTPGFQYLPNLRWGYGEGGFKEGYLYALSRGELWEFHIGIPGKKHISDQ